MLIHRPRSWKVKVWQPEQVIITGAYRGWFGVFFPLIVFAATFWFVFTISNLAAPVLLAIAALGLSARFKLIIHRSAIVVQGSFLGYTFAHETLPSASAYVALGFDWDSLAPPSVEIGSHAIGDEINAIPLFHTIQAAIAHVHGESKLAAGHLGLSSPLTDSPKQTSIDVVTAIRIVERYQRMGLEVLLVRGWKSKDSERVQLYIASEKCHLVFDAYVRTSQIHKLEALRPTTAYNDEMALTTRRRFVWTKTPFRVWQKGTLIAQLYGDTLWTSKGGEIQKNRIISVRGWLSENWAKMGVEFETEDHKKIPLAQGINVGVGFDLFYDGIDLMFDVEWVESISRALAHELKVPCVEDNLSG